MNQAFAPHATALWELAARGLGWRPHEFWNATPAEVTASLGLAASPTNGLDRDALQRLMEHDNG